MGDLSCLIQKSSQIYFFASEALSLFTKYQENLLTLVQNKKALKIQSLCFLAISNIRTRFGVFMDHLQDHLIYPASLELKFGLIPMYQIFVRTQKEELYTNANSFDKALKMSSSVLLDISYALALEETIPSSARFKQHEQLFNQIKTWLTPYQVPHEEVDFQATFLKAGYLAEMVNLIAIANLDSFNLCNETHHAIQSVLQIPLQDLTEFTPNNISTKVKIPRNFTIAKQSSLQYLLGQLFVMNQDQAQSEQLEAILLLGKVANKRIQTPLANMKLKPYHENLQDEVAVVLPLTAVFKIILCNTILSHRVKIRDLADDLHIPREVLEEQLSMYSSSTLDELLLIFNRLGLRPNMDF